MEAARYAFPTEQKPISFLAKPPGTFRNANNNEARRSAGGIAKAHRGLLLLKIPSRNTATVVGALTKHVRKLPQQLRRSLTWDRGKEMADHKGFTVATSVQVYFCDPQSPWQRGSNENTNGLLRQ